MKLEIYNDESPTEKIVRLRLINESGTIKLVMVDVNGRTVSGGYILGFDQGKRGFYLCSSINSDFDFAFTDNGTLKVATW